MQIPWCQVLIGTTEGQVCFSKISLFAYTVLQPCLKANDSVQFVEVTEELS